MMLMCGNTNCIFQFRKCEGTVPFLPSFNVVDGIDHVRIGLSNWNEIQRNNWEHCVNYLSMQLPARDWSGGRSNLTSNQKCPSTKFPVFFWHLRTKLFISVTLSLPVQFKIQFMEFLLQQSNVGLSTTVALPPPTNQTSAPRQRLNHDVHTNHAPPFQKRANELSCFFGASTLLTILGAFRTVLIDAKTHMSGFKTKQYETITCGLSCQFAYRNP